MCLIFALILAIDHVLLACFKLYDFYDNSCKQEKKYDRNE
jgi:hypothetical protein